MQPLPQRQGAMTTDLPAVSVKNEDRLRRVSRARVCIVCFVLHYGEMWVVMAIGMAMFDPVRRALASRGCMGLFDPMSIDSKVGMGIFMVAPMVLWMRIRGCGWRDGGIYTDKAYISSSISYAFQNTKWHMTIAGKTGKDIRQVSRFVKEDEVLFPPDTIFKVVARDDTGYDFVNNTGTIKVWLRQIT